MFEDDPDVITFSMHGSKNFPFRKQRSKLDIELPDGTADTEYLSQLEQALPRVLDFRPEIIFYQSGVDPLDSDRLGRLQLTMQGLRRRDELVFNAVRSAGLPIVVTLGGGYSDPIERTAEAHAQTFRTALSCMTA
jgi:acetoin utilization deacetylase AcuC-like enzyme